MLVVMGERQRFKHVAIGRYYCGYCQSEQGFDEVTRRGIFTVFWLPLIPMGVNARYWQCQKCQHSFSPEQTEQAHLHQVAGALLAYLGLGFNYIAERSPGLAILQNAGVTDEGIAVMLIDQGEQIVKSRGIEAYLREMKASLSVNDGADVVAMAVAMQAACLGQWQHEDRVRINWLAALLDIDMSYVTSLVKRHPDIQLI